MKTLKQKNLRLRLMSGAILLSVALGVVWLGGWWFAAVIAVACAGMCIEWTRLSVADNSKILPLATAALAGASVVALQMNSGALAAGIVGAGTLALWFWCRSRKIEDAAITALSLPYIAGAGLAMVWLRNWTDGGFATVIFLLCVVIAMDIGAYVVGRSLGGPKMAPKISPGKTWSGLIGGALCAGGVGLAAQIVLGKDPMFVFALIGGVLGLLAQGGDLVESALKRRYDVKDSGAIIPGHGGLLDRFDGFLTVFPTAALIFWVFKGSSVTWL